MSEWQNIETAPHDQRILLWNTITGQYISKRRDDGEWPMYDWNGQPGAWFPSPTHWMPLPEPPKED